MVDKADKKVPGECLPKFQFTAGSAVTERTRFSASLAQRLSASAIRAPTTPQYGDTGENPSNV